MDLNIYRHCDTCGHSTLWTAIGGNKAVCGRCFKTKIIEEPKEIPQQRAADKYQSEVDSLFNEFL